MISSAEYNILKSLKQSPELDENRYYNEIRNLLRLKMIEYNVTGEDERHIKYYGFFVTPVGDAAIEDYERMREREKRETETLDTAHEANDIAREANVIAKNANETSKEANKFSKIAIGVSIFAAIISIVSIIVDTVVH